MILDGSPFCDHYGGQLHECMDCEMYEKTYTKDDIKRAFGKIITGHGNLEKTFFDALEE